MIIKKERISLAQESLINLIAYQTRHGEQTLIVKKINQDYFSLGQFLNSTGRNQRGVHGSATGLRVLSESSGNNDLINGLTRYLEDRPENEMKIENEGESISKDKLLRDGNNVIKLAEILYAIHFVKPGISATETLSKKIVEQIKRGMITETDEIGWGFYTDSSPMTIELLPSAYAILALGKYGDDITNAKKTLLKKVDKKKIEDPSSFAEAVFCLYALINVSDELSREEVIKYESLLKGIWNSPFCSLENDFEQNLEYWHNTQHDYVRIPWQMYLLAILSKLSRIKFYTLNCQRRVNSLVEGAINGGFKYHYSGPNLSTRTNAILYDTISVVKHNLDRNFLHSCLVFIDGIRQFFGSKTIKIIGAIFGVLLIIYAIYTWAIDSETKWSDIAPELISSILLTAIAVGRKK